MTRQRRHETGERRGSRTDPPTPTSRLAVVRRASLTPAERAEADDRRAVATDILRCASPEAAATVVELALGLDAQGQPVAIPPAVRLAAAQIVLDRALGRPTQAVEVSGAGGPNAVIAAVLARRSQRETETIDVTPTTRGSQ